jgi:hypothetical protein
MSPPPVRGRRDVGAERAFLLHSPDDLVIGDGDDDRFWIERGADVAVLAVRREDLHARPGWNLDPRCLLVSAAVQHRDVVLAANGDPDLLAIGRKESLVRRPADVGHVLHGVGGRVDESHRVAADRHDGNRPVVGREAHSMHQHLSTVERAQIARLGIPEANHSQELVVGRVGDRDGVGELLGGVDAVTVADRNVRVGGRAGGLSGKGRE